MLNDGSQLVTGGADGVCRLWDITNLEKPLLKSCTRGMTLYAQGVSMDSVTDISPENRALLKQKGALEAKSSLFLEEKFRPESTSSTTTTLLSTFDKASPFSFSSSASTSPPSTSARTSLEALTTQPHKHKKKIADAKKSTPTFARKAAPPSTQFPKLQFRPVSSGTTLRVPPAETSHRISSVPSHAAKQARFTWQPKQKPGVPHKDIETKAKDSSKDLQKKIIVLVAELYSSESTSQQEYLEKSKSSDAHVLQGLLEELQIKKAEKQSSLTA